MNIRYSRRALSQLASVHEYLLMRSPSRVRVIIEPVYGYRTFYSIDDQEVFVIRILHGRQRSPRL